MFFCRKKKKTSGKQENTTLSCIQYLSTRPRFCRHFHTRQYFLRTIKPSTPHHDPSPVNNQHIYARSDERSLPSRPTADPFSCKYMSPSSGRAVRGQALAPVADMAVPSPRGLSSRPLARHHRTPSLDTPTWTPRGKGFGGRTGGRNKRAPGSTFLAEAELIHLFMSAKKVRNESIKCLRAGGGGSWKLGKVRTAPQPSGAFPSCRAYQAERVCIFGAVSPLTLSPADVNGTLIAVALFFSAGFGFFCFVSVFFLVSPSGALNHSQTRANAKRQSQFHTLLHTQTHTHARARASSVMLGWQQVMQTLKSLPPQRQKKEQKKNANRAASFIFRRVRPRPSSRVTQHQVTALLQTSSERQQPAGVAFISSGLFAVI